MKTKKDHILSKLSKMMALIFLVIVVFYKKYICVCAVTCSSFHYENAIKVL